VRGPRGHVELTASELYVSPETVQYHLTLCLLDHDRLEPCAFRDPTHDAICDREENSSLVSIMFDVAINCARRKYERFGDRAVAQTLRH
jgi:hypothetical protein